MDLQTSLTPCRNYMKPTSCSDARKGKVQVTVTSPVCTDKTKKSFTSSKNSISLKSSSFCFTKVLNRQSSLKTGRSISMKKSSMVAKKDMNQKLNLNRATCSSTLKDSKFPAALVLDHGATEAEGTSKMRVCPYTYCSLNGHVHESLPPLKSFISARRKLVEAQRNMETMGFCSVKTGKNKEKKIDVKKMDEIRVQEEIIVDNCDEIRVQEEEKDQELDCAFDAVVDSSETMPQMDELSDIYLEHVCDMDQITESSQDEIDDDLMNFLEIDDERKAQEEDGVFEQYTEVKSSGIQTMNMDEEDDLFFGGSVMVESGSHETLKDESSVKISSDLASQSVVDKITNPKQDGIDTIADRTSEHSDGVADESKKLENETARTMSNVSNIDFDEIDSVLSSRWNISRKAKIEEFEQATEFNPRPPNFLPLEPDPEAEKVDLRHQMMDGRKSSEEWMVDYALQQAVTRLGGPSRKRKVAILVKAFETVLPLHVCEQPLSHGASAFAQLSFIQACN